MLDNELLQEQRQVLTVRQLQSLEILAFTNQELNAFLTNEYLENPMLEDPQNREEEDLKDLEQLYEKGVTYREQYTRWGEEEDNRREDIRAAAPDELEEFLLGQLDARAYTPTEWELMGYLVKCLDEKGFFSYETEEIARAAGVPKDVVCRCLGVLRKLEPVGIFAKDISECLIRQLERDGCRDELLYRIVREYMEDLLQGHISVISRSLKLSTAKVKEYISRISRLNPRPVMSVAERGVAYVVPDILAEWEKGAWEVRLNDNWTGECRYNQYYIRMMEEAKDRELLQYFQEKLERARFVTDCVEQRRKTLLSVARIILEYQQEYFLGKGPLKPMSMELIAQMAGIHVSTVSRAVKDKYLQYRKTYLLRDLFTAAVAAREEVSVLSVKKEIERMIGQEDKRYPLSDARIAELMKEKGVEISRRTVAKYRGQLGILESRQRLYLEK